jgi:hypothetical protein
MIPTYGMEFRQWILNEIDWDGGWKDVQKECLDMNALVAYLNDVRSNRGKDTKDRKKFPDTMPFIHAKSKLFKPGDLDVDDFIKRITEKPNNVVNRNEKMEKSGMSNEFVYKTGIPAFRGIIYDIEADKFYVINTCPGAGSCVVICYARRNNYIRYSGSYDSMTRRLNYMLNFPEKYEEMLYEELKEKCEEHGAKVGYEPKVLFRWNDSGDFFSRRYRLMAYRVMRRLTADGYNISDAAYTKVADVVNDNPDSMKVAYSAGGKKSEADKVAGSPKTSKIVPKEMLAGLDLMKISDKQKLKGLIAKNFGLDESDILTYSEMMRTSLSDHPKWHVIVTPGDGDDAVHRADVKTILLTQH